MTDEPVDTRSMIELAWEAYTVDEDADLASTLAGFRRALQRLQQLLNKRPSGGAQDLATHPLSVCWAAHVAGLAGLDHMKSPVVLKARNWAYQTGNGVTDADLTGCIIKVEDTDRKRPSR